MTAMEVFKDRLKAMTDKVSYGFTELGGKKLSTPSANDIMSGVNAIVGKVDRENLYLQVMQALATGNADTMRTVYDIANMSEGERLQVKKLTNDIVKSMVGINSLSGGDGGGEQAGGAYWADLYEKIRAVQTAPAAEAAKGAEAAPGAAPAAAPSKEEVLGSIAKANRNHPIFGPDTLKATMIDRVIFIAITFVMRSFSMTCLHWALTSRMVNTFEYAIVFYVFVYLMFFAFWVLLVNVNRKDLTLHVLFYYVNFDSDYGSYRVLLHSLLQFLLLPIPFVIRTRNTEKNPKLEVADQVRALNMVGKLSFTLWALGAFIALRF